jgi:hypothetical protein
VVELSDDIKRALNPARPTTVTSVRQASAPQQQVLTAVQAQYAQQQDVTRAFLDTSEGDIVQTRVTDVRREGRWMGVPDCGGYMGVALYDIPCTADAYFQKIWMFDTYKACQSWLSAGIMSAPASSSDRTRWFAQIVKFISSAHAATGLKPVWTHPRKSALGFNPGMRTLAREIVDPLGRGTRSGQQPPSAGSVLATNLSLFGPPEVTTMVERWWKAARAQGRRLYIPISHSLFFSGATGFPGQPVGELIPATSILSGAEAAGSAVLHNAIERDILFLEEGNVAGTGEPWDLMEDGRYLKPGVHTHEARRWTVEPGEARAWSFDGVSALGTFASGTRYGDLGSVRTVGGFIALDPISGGEGHAALTRSNVFDAIARRNDRTELVPLELLFPQPEYAASDEFFVPSWAALSAYVRAWARPLLAPEGEFIMSGWRRYITYFEQWPPEALGLSAREYSTILHALRQAAIEQDLLTIGVASGVAMGVASMINPIVAVAVLVVQLVASLIAIFKERRVPCPPIPMPFMMKSGPVGSDCDFGSPDQAPVLQVVRTVIEAQSVGLNLPLPSNIDPQFVGSSLPPLPPPGADTKSRTSWLIAGALAAAAGVVLFAAARRGDS